MMGEKGNNVFDSPNRLVSLRDMIQFVMQEMVALSALDGAINKFQVLKGKHPVGTVTRLDSDELLNGWLPQVEKFCQKLKLSSSLHQLFNLKTRLVIHGPANFSDIVSLLYNFRLTIGNELTYDAINQRCSA